MAEEREGNFTTLLNSSLLKIFMLLDIFFEKLKKIVFNTHFGNI